MSRTSGGSASGPATSDSPGRAGGAFASASASEAGEREDAGAQAEAEAAARHRQPRSTPRHQPATVGRSCVELVAAA
ncbi:hypothetical protein BMMON3_12400 [Burkholderia mallei]